MKQNNNINALIDSLLKNDINLVTIRNVVLEQLGKTFPDPMNACLLTALTMRDVLRKYYKLNRYPTVKVNVVFVHLRVAITHLGKEIPGISIGIESTPTAFHAICIIELDENNVIYVDPTATQAYTHTETLKKYIPLSAFPEFVWGNLEQIQPGCYQSIKTTGEPSWGNSFAHGGYEIDLIYHMHKDQTKYLDVPDGKRDRRKEPVRHCLAFLKKLDKYNKTGQCMTHG